MAIEVLLKVNDIDVTANVLTPFEIDRNKLWADDSGRVISGRMVGTMIGIFPKLNALLYPNDANDISDLMTELDKASQSLKYYNPKTKTLVDLGTYTNDYKVTLLDLTPTYDSIKVSFISIDKE